MADLSRKKEQIASLLRTLTLKLNGMITTFFIYIRVDSLGNCGSYLVAVGEEFCRRRVEGVCLDVSAWEVALEQSGHFEVLSQVSDLLVGESGVVSLEPPSIAIANTFELVSNDASGGLTDSGQAWLFRNDGGVKVDVGDLSVERSELGCDGSVGVDVEEARERIWRRRVLAR